MKSPDQRKLAEKTERLIAIRHTLCNTAFRAQSPWDCLQRLCDQTCIVVSTKDNAEALNLLLSSLVTTFSAGLKIPRIVIRYEGLCVANFYREQLITSLHTFGTEVLVIRAESCGVHKMREWMITTDYVSPFSFVLMLDDDVILQADSITHMFGALADLIEHSETEDKVFSWAYLQGTKWDCANTRQYANFSLKPVPYDKATNYNVPVEYAEVSNAYKPTRWLDTGFALFNMAVVANLTFVPSDLKKVANCGGEDALFALQAYSKGYVAYWAPLAQAIHLEKPQGTRFPEAAYRKEAVLRAASQLGYDTSHIDEFLPWVPIHNL